MLAIALLATTVDVIASNADYVGEKRVAPVFSHRIVAQFPHDESHFTQGLEWHDGRFIESAGGYGVSAVLEKNAQNGETLRRFSLPPEFFAEGITKFRDRLYLLTWRERLAIVFDLAFKPQRTLRYEGEGWGLTHDGRELIMSDGSARLTFRDPDSFAIKRTVDVRDGTRPVALLNELEYARGLVLANIWQSTHIAMIAPADGRVVGWLDLRDLLARLPATAMLDPRDDVLNGIAYNRDTGHLYVTGKRWPLLFELSVDWPAKAKK